MDIIVRMEINKNQGGAMNTPVVPIKDLLYDLKNNKSEIKDYDSVLTQNACWNRHLYLGDIDSEIASMIESFIRFYNQEDEEANIPIEERLPIKIFINSGGGDLMATFMLIDAIKLSRTPVWTINIGSAYSGGFFTFIAGHKRIAYPNSTFLYHEGSTMNAGDAGKFRNFADFYDKLLDMLKDVTISNTQITEELYAEHKKDDWWLTADEALELGICDEIAKEFVV